MDKQELIALIEALPEHADFGRLATEVKRESSRLEAGLEFRFKHWFRCWMESRCVTLIESGID